jgi:hypothetical protein
VKTDFPINIVTVLRSTVRIGTVKTDFPVTIVILGGSRRDEDREQNALLCSIAEQRR